jgi:mannose-1-phosphate guanylyltransferase
MFIPLIMAGGAGTRFWPASRNSFPKQFLSIVSGSTLINETVQRLSEVTDPENIHIATTASQTALIREFIPDLAVENILIEPCLRDTAPCIGLASFILQKKYEGRNPVIGVFPADHVIRDNEVFIRTVNAAWETAREKDLICQMGIKPAYPATGYGYIHRGGLISELNDVSIYNVREFKEKPDKETAEGYLSTGEYYWNSGIFIFKPETMIKEMETYLPEMHAGLSRIADSGMDLLDEVYPDLEKISIDYGIIERTEHRCVAEAEYSWDDVGSWEAVEKYFDRDPQGNAVHGEFIGVDSDGCVVYSKEGTMVAGVGVSDLIIVNTGDAVLVCPKDRAQDVKKIVNLLKEEGRDELL